MVVLGATGDMARSKLLPALYWLWHARKLQGVRLILVANATSDSIREAFHHALSPAATSLGAEPSSIDEMATELQMRALRVDLEGAEHDRHYYRLLRQVAELSEEDTGKANVTFYLAVPPKLYSTVAEHLVKHDVLKPPNTRIVIEKPFGESQVSSARLILFLQQKVRPQQVMLVDHYLYKDMVLRLADLRSQMESDTAFDALRSIWNRRYIKCVEISVAESEGIGDRGEFFESVGALCDMVQNHLLQLLCTVVAPLPPMDKSGKRKPFENMAPRDSVISLVKKPIATTRKLAEHWIVRGQYVANNDDMKSYRQEKFVNRTSEVETFVAVRFRVHHPDWEDTPFFLRTGKRMAERRASIVLSFSNGDRLMFRIQPNPQIVIDTKARNSPLRVLRERCGAISVQEDELFVDDTWEGRDKAYESIISECLEGKLAQGVSLSWIDESWSLMKEIEAIWAEDARAPLNEYEAFTDGPPAADYMMHVAGLEWTSPGVLDV